MNLEKLTRKIIALENRNQVNYASVAGNAFSLSKGETTVGIDLGAEIIYYFMKSVDFLYVLLFYYFII